MSDELVLWEKDATDAFVTLTMNRPDKLNAMNQALGDALEAAIVRAVADPDIRAVILTGAGRAFLDRFRSRRRGFRTGRGRLARGHRRQHAAAQADSRRADPDHRRVNGFALAGGLELMLCCDMTIAAEDAKLGEPEVRHVSAPPTLMLPWTVPMPHARYLMYTGDLIDGREAERIHLVNKAVPRERLKEEAERLARKCARMPGSAIKFAKAALNHHQETQGLQSSWSYNRETTAISARQRGRQTLDADAEGASR